MLYILLMVFLLKMQLVILSIACLIVLVFCNSLSAQAANVPDVIGEADVLPGADQLNVDDLYGQNRVKVVRRSPEQISHRAYIFCATNNLNVV